MRISNVILVSIVYSMAAILSTVVSPEHLIPGISLSSGVVAASVAVYRWSTVPAILLGNLGLWLFPIDDYPLPLSATASDLFIAFICIPLWQYFSKGQIVVQNRDFAIRVALWMTLVVLPFVSILKGAVIGLQLGTYSNFETTVTRLWQGQLIGIFFLAPLLAQTFRKVEARAIELPSLLVGIKQLTPHAAMILLVLLWFADYFRDYPELLLLLSLASYIVIVMRSSVASMSFTALIVLLLFHYMSHLRQVPIAMTDGDFLTLALALGVFGPGWFLMLQLEKLRKIALDEQSSGQLAKDDALRTTTAMFDALNRLSLSRDNETGNHILRTQHYVRAIAQELQLSSSKHAEQLTNQFIDTLFIAAPLHDIGKVGIPDSILLKPGKLNDDQWAVMKTHALIGERVLTSATGEVANFDLSIASEVAGGHHEKWDGSGYPRGLEGEQIPLSARIMAIADVFDALTTARVYKEAWPHDKAIAEIKMLSGSHFDPVVVQALLNIQPELLRISQQFSDEGGPLESGPSPTIGARPLNASFSDPLAGF